MIPSYIKLKNNALPDNPGVYFYYDVNAKLMYVGKATSLKKRVGSYFTKAHDRRIADLVSKIARIDYIETPTVIEALVLEANQIKAHKPFYNILERDDKSFVYLVLTNEAFPKPVLMRGLELERMGVNPFSSRSTLPRFKAIYGPYISGRSLKIALDLVRKSIPWSLCSSPFSSPLKGGRNEPCFYRQLHQCPGVCTGEISRREYAKVIRNLMLFFEGKKTQVLRALKKEMVQAAKQLEFEKAEIIKRRIFALEHVQDVALISAAGKDPSPALPLGKGREMSTRPYIDILRRIEAYDISNVSGTSAVGSMVVFENGKPAKNEYRRFKIKTVKGANDVAMMEEVMRRRLARAKNQPNAWPLPQLLVIDGGLPQVNRVQHVLDELGIVVPIVGLAKGFDRKQDRLVFSSRVRHPVTDPWSELKRVVETNKEILQRARDEAHRFAVSYHRKLRGKRSIFEKSRDAPVP